MARYRNENPDAQGWSRWVTPNPDRYKFRCCDCGLVHEMQFRVADDINQAEFRAKRDNRATGQIRRKQDSHLKD